MQSGFYIFFPSKPANLSIAFPRRTGCSAVAFRPINLSFCCLEPYNIRPALHNKCRAFFRKSPKIRLHKGEINLKYTKNYQLNQWDAADRVLREDFNRDNQKIDTALEETAILARSCYTRLLDETLAAPCQHWDIDLSSIAGRYKPMGVSSHQRMDFRLHTERGQQHFSLRKRAHDERPEPPKFRSM